MLYFLSVTNNSTHGYLCLRPKVSRLWKGMVITMKQIHGMTFAPFAMKGSFEQKEAYESLKNLKERTAADFIVLVPNGVQETAQSEMIDYTSPATMGDEELKRMIAYAQEMNLRVGIKPTANCKNGTWRAHINFFDEDVHCEPKWSNWFASYTDFQMHYAKIAQEMGCSLFIAGCEMVMAERRETEWRRLIEDIRGAYHGPVTYNTDKYQEHHVKWWDCLDYISSSGYYPAGDWEKELDRIEKVVKEFDKPFFFAEAGCMSTQGSPAVPNDWNRKGAVDTKGQAAWFREMFDACEKRDWIKGHVIWDWAWKQYPLKNADHHGGYDIYGKCAEKVVYEFYSRG